MSVSADLAGRHSFFVAPSLLIANYSLLISNSCRSPRRYAPRDDGCICVIARRACPTRQSPITDYSLLIADSSRFPRRYTPRNDSCVCVIARPLLFVIARRACPTRQSLSPYSVILSNAKDLLAGNTLCALSLVGFEGILHFVQNDILFCHPEQREGSPRWQYAVCIVACRL